MSGLGLNGQLHDIIDANVKAQFPDSSVLYAAYLDDVMLQQVAQHPVQGSSARQAWEVFGTMAILEMVTRCLHEWGSAREDTMGTLVMALCCRTTQLASTNFGFWT